MVFAEDKQHYLIKFLRYIINEIRTKSCDLIIVLVLS